MDLDILVDGIKARLVADGFVIADHTLDLAQHVPSNPESAGASSVHPDNEIRDTVIRNTHRDTIRVTTVTRLTASHTMQDAWLKERNLRRTVTGRYEHTRVFYSSSVRSYHPANKGWYLTTQLFSTIRKVTDEY